MFRSEWVVKNWNLTEILKDILSNNKGGEDSQGKVDDIILYRDKVDFSVPSR